MNLRRPLSQAEEHLLEALFMRRETLATKVRSVCDHPVVADGEALAGLVALGLAEVTGEEPTLTAAGREHGGGIVRRHRLTEVLLDTVLKLDRHRAFDIGCQVEHQMQPEMEEAFCTLLGHPTTCPHGRSIPPGPCCTAGRRTVESRVVRLTELRPGERGRIIFISPRSHERLHRLAALGVTPGVVVELHQLRPAVCFRFEGTELAVEKDVATDIHVSRLPSSEERQPSPEPR